jgi:hypothetical protein
MRLGGIWSKKPFQDFGTVFFSIGYLCNSWTLQQQQKLCAVGVAVYGLEAAHHNIHHSEPAMDDWHCHQPPVPGSIPCQGRGLGGHVGGPMAFQGGPSACLSEQDEVQFTSRTRRLCTAVA